jgi:hypothetical protein
MGENQYPAIPNQKHIQMIKHKKTLANNKFLEPSKPNFSRNIFAIKLEF